MNRQTILAAARNKITATLMTVKARPPKIVSPQVQAGVAMTAARHQRAKRRRQHEHANEIRTAI
jgi:hypothetical protein